MSDVVVNLDNVSKFYRLYDDSRDRLKEALHPGGKKYHKKYYALGSLDLKIRRGEILGIIGKNGCGKSTLLKLITGVLQPSKGSVTTKGKITALLELGAGFNPEFTGIDNVKFYAKILGLSDKEIASKLDQIIEFAELGVYLDQPVKTYSSGMKSRLGFAVAAHVDPEILILDEVLAVGDEAFRAKCFRVIRKFFDSGMTVILVSHSVQSINQLCTRAVLIEDGSVVADGKPKDVTKIYHKMLFGNKKAEDVMRTLPNNNTGNLESIKSVGEWDQKLVVNPENMLTEEMLHTDNYKLLNSQGEQVNTMTVNYKYNFTFEVELNGVDPERVVFGCTFVSSKGINVCGLSPQITVRKSKPLIFDVNFPCILNPDIYTVIVASRVRSKEVVYYSRVENIGHFRVINPESKHRSGLVHVGDSVMITSDRKIN
jgi:ABC-type polysaccharide/polyol phosphate transport system ATPase subunit